MRVFVLTVALALSLIAGCGDTTTSSVVTVDLSGRWAGDNAAATFSLVLTETDSRLTGSGAMFGPGDRFAPPAQVEVSGQRTKNSVALEFTVSSFSMAFSGTLVSRDRIDGILEHPTRGSIPLVLNRSKG
jgi:hypothetical protein